MTDFRVIIDADACPRSCLRLVQDLAPDYGYQVVTVASFNHVIDNPLHLVVGDEPQATDIAIINRTQANDIVVTQDWGLAAMVLGKQAAAIAPNGKIFDEQQIELLLEQREVLAKYRRGGGRTRGPAKRGQDDERRFAEGFRKLIATRRPN